MVVVCMVPGLYWYRNQIYQSNMNLQLYLCHHMLKEPRNEASVCWSTFCPRLWVGQSKPHFHVAVQHGDQSSQCARWCQWEHRPALGEGLN